MDLRELGLIAIAMEACHKVAERLSARYVARRLTEDQIERCRALSEARKGMRFTTPLEEWRRYQGRCEELLREIEGWRMEYAPA